jgi:hypothetical protein
MILAGGGRHSAECDGDCTLSLDLSAAIVLDDGRCTSLLGELDVERAGSAARRVLLGVTDTTWEQAARISRDLAAAPPDPESDCVQCTDKASAWITLRGPDSSEEPRSLHYALGKPPAALRAADALVQELIDQAQTCRGAHLGDCITWDVDAGTPIEPSCGGSSVARPSCSCADRPDTIDGMPCDGSCGTCTFAGSWECTADCVQPCDGGSRIWRSTAVVCE